MAYPQMTFAETQIYANDLIGRRRETICISTLSYQLQVLKDTGRYDAFKLKWHPAYDQPRLVWPVPNHIFWDSDVAKWIEGACYFLKQRPLREIDLAVRELVEMIAAAQQVDGYLNIHYSVVEPGMRFTNLRDMHELYNCGHLIEAALAHNDHYKNDLLLAPVLRYVDLLCRTFGAGLGQIHGYPGHPGIELALLRLYDRSGDSKHFALARYFIMERGNSEGDGGQNFFISEALMRDKDRRVHEVLYTGRIQECLWYYQAHAPVAQQSTIEGHSVRAMYLLTAVADLLRIEEPNSHGKLAAALYRLWDNMVEQKMYITGGIGAIQEWEGFGRNYFLPQSSQEGGCHAETCASIGVMMLAQRLLQIDLDAKFADTLELCLYNTILAAMSHDGKAFSYMNQLASSGEHLAERSAWFTMSCCPPNLLRLFGQMGGFIWSHTVDKHNRAAIVLIHLYVSSSLKFAIDDEEISINQSTSWPWKSDIEFTLQTGSTEVEIKLRIPHWATSYILEPPCPEACVLKGYLTLPKDWVSKHHDFKLNIPLKPRWLASHPLSNQRTLSLARGPVVYCVEDVDHTWVDDHFASIFVHSNSTLVEGDVVDRITGDEYVQITLRDGARRLDVSKLRTTSMLESKALAAALETAERLSRLYFSPFCFRANRGGKGHMRVGLKSLDG